ncbi:hypothetical protein [Caballeronia cordobensis]|uniref:hypothetical protein n=1 Tax=Caballeronia cordobensis TaxID=1353886 RepID=UPI00045F0D3D|nr:hypothetical protein BRPE67_ACDS09470 [Burkholderia sp. RPE67]
MTTYTDTVLAGVGLNMRNKAEEQELAAAHIGVAVDIKTKVHKQDGSKNYATELAKALCETPALAKGTREDLATLITTRMGLDKPFGAYRLSKALTSTAKRMVVSIMNEHGYNTIGLNSALDIRNIIQSGERADSTGEHTINTRFEVDGVWLGRKWYPYERFVTYETDSPWYFLGIRFAGNLIQLKNVLAMRDIGINQFIGLDEAAHKRATAGQLATRAKLCAERH